MAEDVPRYCRGLCCRDRNAVLDWAFGKTEVMPPFHDLRLFLREYALEVERLSSAPHLGQDYVDDESEWGA